MRSGGGGGESMSPFACWGECFVFSSVLWVTAMTSGVGNQCHLYPKGYYLEEVNENTGDLDNPGSSGKQLYR